MRVWSCVCVYVCLWVCVGVCIYVWVCIHKVSVQLVRVGWFCLFVVSTMWAHVDLWSPDLVAGTFTYWATPLAPLWLFQYAYTFIIFITRFPSSPPSPSPFYSITPSIFMPSLFLDFTSRKNTQFFLNLVYSTSTTISSFIHFPRNNMMSFFFLPMWYCTICVSCFPSLLIHCRHRGWFCDLVLGRAL